MRAHAVQLEEIKKSAKKLEAKRESIEQDSAESAKNAGELKKKVIIKPILLL